MAADASGLLGSLYIQLTADSTELVRSVRGAEDTVKNTASKMSDSVRGVTNLLKGLAAALAIRQIASFTSSVLQSVDALRKFGQETGVATQKIAELDFAARKANVGDTFQVGMRKFSEAVREAQVQGSEMQRMFQTLNINPFQDLDKALLQTADAFAGMEDGVNKMGLAQELFGRQNTRFINLLSGGSAELEKQSALYRRLSGVDMNEAAAQAEAFNDAMTDLQTASTGLVLIATKELIPALTSIMEQFRDNSETFREFASIIGTALPGAVKLAAMSFQGLMGTAKVASIAVVGLAEVWVRAWRFAFEQIATLVNMTVNGVISGVNKAISVINSLASRLPGGSSKMIGQIDFQLNLDAPFQSEMGDIADTLRETRLELLDQLMTQFSTQEKIIEQAGAANKEAIQKHLAPNIEELKEHLAREKAFLADYEKMRSGLAQDIIGLSGMGEMAQYQGLNEEVNQTQRQLEALRELGNGKIALTEEVEQKRLEIMRLYSEKQRALELTKTKLILNSTSAMFGDLAMISAAFGGKQSEVYKAMFAASKAFAVAEATIKIMQGIAAAASTPWPMNLLAMGQVIAATASIVSNIQSVQLEFGGARAAGGPVDPGKAFLVGENGPELFIPPGSGNIIPNDRLNGGVKVVVNNNAGAEVDVTERREGDERVIEVMLRRIKREMAGDIKDGRGELSRALESTFGVRRGQTQ